MIWLHQYYCVKQASIQKTAENDIAAKQKRAFLSDREHGRVFQQFP
jgi:hypothetical protein